MINAIFYFWVTINLLMLIYVLQELGLMFNALLRNRRRSKHTNIGDLPIVTVQLPLYNEKYVVERLLTAVSQLDYPKEKLEIQVLDDSTDETTEVISAFIAQSDLDFAHIRRPDRTGFKAGALAYGMASCKGEFIAIFDADFVPKPEFLKETIPHFNNEKTGVVQTRWLHLNEDQSLLTRAQSVMLNTHFSIEQLGRSNANGYINFNGTAGIWRKLCIEDAGGWQADTLTEDLDLSFRAQARGWHFEYLFEVGSPAELPVTFDAFRTQQFRWSKGAAECLRKNWTLLWSSKARFDTKLMGSFHLLNSSVYLLVVLIFLISPLTYFLFSNNQVDVPYANYLVSIGTIVSALLLFIFFVGNLTASQNKIKAAIWYIPSVFMFFAMTTGISLYMVFGVIEGYIGKRSEFVRTPKFGDDGNIVKKVKRGYAFKKEYSIRVLEFIFLGYGIFWSYIGFKELNPLVTIFSTIILTGFSLSLFFKHNTFKMNQ